MDKIIKVGMLGFGTVGSGVARVLKENAQEITEKIGAQLKLSKVLVRDVNKKRPYMEDLSLTSDIDDILSDESISIVIELIGGIHPAKEYMLKALESGKHVVTANKDVIAQYGRELFNMAEKHDADLMFEASVGGGIPIIMPLKRSLTANKIEEVMGIVNGTTNYMLTKMAQCGSSYEDALQEAQAKGYAEADPTADVEGLDAARKAAILASIAFNTRVGLDKVSVEGINKITQADIEYADELGYVIKLLAIANDLPHKGVNVRVHPAFVPKNHPLAAVNGVYNAIFVRGNAIGEAMFYGKGAGALPTASAVVADVVEEARDIVSGSFGRIHCTCYEHKQFCSLDDTISAYYVRLLVEDKPGVLGEISTAFGNNGVSLNSVIQTRKVGSKAEIVAVTHEVEHRRIKQTIASFQSMSVVSEIESIIRVETSQEEY